MRVWNKNELDKLIFVVYKMANTELSNEWLINVFSGKLEDIFKFEIVGIKMNTLYYPVVFQSQELFHKAMQVNFLFIFIAIFP